MDYFRLAQPNLDTKPGTVARDLMIEAPASYVGLLYDELSSVSSQQSLRTVVGSDLDKLAKNYGLTRRQSTSSTGTVLLTFSSIGATITINSGDQVFSTSRISFTVNNGIAVSPSQLNFYRSIASKFSDQLTTAGITDQYAVQVTVTATSAGSAGNIGLYAIDSSNSAGVSNATNVVAFAGGTDQESDAAFRNRILSSFSGASVGTALGYLNVALGTTGVSDAYVVQPGDVLMTRDGTVVETIGGVPTIVSEGSGGKVDIVVLGETLVSTMDTYIYIDKSNNNDPTNAKNNFVLGQIAADANKTINRKRIDDIANGVLPNQPVSNIVSVSGSISGSNFVQQTTDSLGRTSGNYKLTNDTGAYGGSPWGFDTFSWTSNQISMFPENIIKGQVNGQDPVTFTDVLAIPQIQQNVGITNENSITTSNRSFIQLLHTPATNVTRVYNVNTGERYVIVNPNPDSTGTYNTTGRVQISGNTLPSPSDQLQVDYVWIVNYDGYSDYDGLTGTNNPRTVDDSIDWGYASVISNEKISYTLNTSTNFFTGTSTYPVGNIISAKTFTEIYGTVTTVSSGSYVNRLCIILSELAVPTTLVSSVTWKHSVGELFNTAQNNGLFINSTQVSGIQIRYQTMIVLPSDTVAQVGSSVSCILNSTDVFNTVGNTGSFSGTQITIPAVPVATTATTITLLTTYIANAGSLFSVPTTSLPASRLSNGLLLGSNNGFNNFSQVNISRRENQTVQVNTSNQILIELNLLATDYSLSASQVLSVIRLSDNVELWNSNNVGTVQVGSDGNYQVVLNGSSSAAAGNNVLIIYYATDLSRFQPFSYQNRVITSREDTLTLDLVSNRLTLPLNKFFSQASSLAFTVSEINSNISLFSVSDGYLTSEGSTALLSSVSTSFSSLPDLLNKKVRISGAHIVADNGSFDIVSYNSGTNQLTITNDYSQITADQIMVIRVSDGKEVWGYNGTIDLVNNRLLLPVGAKANPGDSVYLVIFDFSCLSRTATKLIGTISDQVSNVGTITVGGTTITQVSSAVFTATEAGLQQSLLPAIQAALSLSSPANIPAGLKLVKIASLQKVQTVGGGNNSILETLATYDLKGLQIKNNLLYPDQTIGNTTLGNMDFILPGTANNNAAAPALGDQLLITFYYTLDGDSESFNYSRIGTLYSNKKFALINNVFVSSGFKASQSTRLSVINFTQPPLGSRYTASYNYTAPQQNERIVITYNYNQLIGMTTFNVENTRPINADVLVKQAQEVLLDLTMYVVIADSYQSSQATIIQNILSQVQSAMTTTTLGETVDGYTLINIAQGVTGVARARISYFNITGQQGSVISVIAQNNQYFSPNNVSITPESF
jgi:hypothetical protein